MKWIDAEPQTIILQSLILGCPEKVTAMRYIPNSSNDTDIKNSNFLVKLAPQPSSLIPGLGWFLLPPNHKKPFHFYKTPVAAAAAAAPTTSSYGIPSPVRAQEKIKFHQCHNHDFKTVTK